MKLEYFTSECSKQVNSYLEHETRNSVSPNDRVILLYKILTTQHFLLMSLRIVF